MARSIKKGPFIDGHLQKKVEEAKKSGSKKSNQNVVPPEHNQPGIRGSDNRCTQRQETSACVRDREHGGSQARRIFSDTHVPGTCRGEEVGKSRQGEVDNVLAR